MRKHIPNEDTGRVLATTLVAWGAITALATAEGVLAKLSHGTLLALGVFAFVFAAGTYLLDAQLRRYLRSIDLRILGAAAAVLDGAIVVALVAGLTPAPLLVFAGPVALALHLAYGEALARAFRPAASAKSPAGKQAAI